MKRLLRTSAAAIALAAPLWAAPALAGPADAGAIQQELAAMRAQMQAMALRIDTLEGQLAEARAKSDAAGAAAASAAAVPAKPDTAITWDGAPKFTGRDGFSFKPRGRLQMDVGGVDGPAGIGPQRSLGFATELRRAYIGFDGTLPGGFGYRIEADLASGSLDLTDLYLTYKATPELTFAVGHQKLFDSMEDTTSDLFTSFMERAAFNSAFGFERRLGVSATYAAKTLLVQGGVFNDGVRDLNDTNNSFSLDGRVVFMPKLAGGQLHLGGSVHYRELNDVAHSVSYGARPFVRTTDLRLVNTGNILGTESERGLGVELAYVRGRWHATAESRWQTAMRFAAPDPTFNGGYAELGYLLTDDVTAYRGGAYDRIRPKTPLGAGGIGALQVNARYDWLDLSDAGVTGGRQQAAGLSFLWIPTAYVRFIVNYGDLWIEDAALPANGDRDYSVDTLGMRAQFDF